ncbi:pyroglutamyl-peptidase I [Dokdonella sp.]|uniref:pyroglutamyl-peptidase I n=1 Tax=Dokdonella sp. TaxID=2291710 RepID=UPI001B179C40|nr:pyroglutamyl-peptidase I [Dokdonella sp.]MBO9662629.1 pyroglutamyl-peptidase I [Dokdonella sp.]
MIDEPAILLTGFESFGGERINPSREIVLALDGETIGAHRVVGAILPVAFSPTHVLLEALLEEHRPRLVLALGQAGGRGEISLERVAVNLIDARIADNDGLQPIDEAIVEGAPGAYFSTLPLKAMRARLHDLGIPAALSLSAGSYVCNQVFFVLAHLLATRWPQARGGFVHVPLLPEQAVHHPGQPSMALETMLAGVRAALECALANGSDLRVAGGTTC